MRIPNIPRVMHLYWDGSPMSFLQFLTVKSFQKHNPEWHIKLHLPLQRYSGHTWSSFEQKDPYLGKNYIDWLFELDIEIVNVDFEDIGFRNDIPEVVKSDYLRYHILGHEGGFWSDFDVLYFKSLQSIFDGKAAFRVLGASNDVNAIICPVIKDEVLKYYTIGFLASSAGNPLFLDLAEACLEYLDLSRYQSIGVNMIKELFPTPDSLGIKYGAEVNLLVMPHEAYLPLEYNQTEYLFEKKWTEDFPDYTVGIHWFNGHPDAKSFQNKMGDPGRLIRDQGTLYQHLEPYLVPRKMIDTSRPILDKSEVAESFSDAYDKNLWGDAESRSGAGSTNSATSKLRRELQDLLIQFEIETIVDLACGDFNWMQMMDLSNVKYLGVDIVDQIIQRNRANFSNQSISFEKGDLVRGFFKKCDLVILRDVLVHLTLEDTYYVLNNIVESGSTYLLTTSFTSDRINIDLRYSGEQWRTLSLHNAPFHFPRPIQLINEDCQEGNGLYGDKSLVLYEIDTLVPYLNKFEVNPMWLSAP